MNEQNVVFAMAKALAREFPDTDFTEESALIDIISYLQQSNPLIIKTLKAIALQSDCSFQEAIRIMNNFNSFSNNFDQSSCSFTVETRNGIAELDIKNYNNYDNLDFLVFDDYFNDYQ